MAADDRNTELPVSWDEAREIVVVILLATTVLRLLSPLVGFIDNRWGNFTDDVAEAVRNANTTTGLVVLAAGVLIATTPRADVVPALRTATVIIASVVVLQAVVGIIIELTRTSGAGFLGRLVTVFGRFLPGALLGGTARWLATRVVPFDD